MRPIIAKRRTTWLDLEARPITESRKTAPRIPTFHASLEAVSRPQVVDAIACDNLKPSTPLQQIPQQKVSRRPTLAEQIATGLRNHLRARNQKRSKIDESNPPAGQIQNSRVRKQVAATTGSASGSPVTLAGAWSWLRKKYESSATKRLRVTEVASLGEKRFVALVNVGNREFLVGGGTSGVTVLTPLETAHAKTEWVPADLSVAGDYQ